MTTSHVYAALIKLWADGVEIECFSLHSDKWMAVPNPRWEADTQYRIKPEPVSNKVTFRSLHPNGDMGAPYIGLTSIHTAGYKKALRIEINPTTLELVSAYVVSTETGETV